ncbi:MAG: hypothetical protein AAGH76_13040 [Pseudomonadota bacterium]
MTTMRVAAFSQHGKNGWQALHDLHGPWANEAAAGAAQRLGKARDLLREHGNFDWLTDRYG